MPCSCFQICFSICTLRIEVKFGDEVSWPSFVYDNEWMTCSVNLLSTIDFILFLLKIMIAICINPTQYFYNFLSVISRKCAYEI